MAAKSTGKRRTTKKTAGKKTTATKKKPTTRKTGNTGRKKTAAKGELGFLKMETLIWTLLTLYVLMFISNLGIGGAAGRFISGLLFGGFGWMAYPLPILLFLGTIFLAANRRDSRAWGKILAATLCFVMISTLLQLIDGKGGKLGGAIEKLLAPNLGVAGAYIVTFVLLILSFVYLSGKSALKGIKDHGEVLFDKLQEEVAVKRENARLRREEERENTRQRRQAEREEKAARRRREEEELPWEEDFPSVGLPRRMDRKVEGVSFDTTISEAPVSAGELSVSDRPVRGAKVTREPEETVPVIQREETEKEDMSREEGLTTKRKKHLEKDEAQKQIAEVESEAARQSSAQVQAQVYEKPPLSLLKKGKRGAGESDTSLRETSMKLQQTLKTFGVNVTVTNISCGPSVTRYELQPEMGVKVSKIVGLSDDIKLNLAAADIRIEAPIPGKAAVGIEVPNKENSAVMLRDLLESDAFQRCESNLAFAAGKDIGGKVVVADLAKMPHVLIAGATGSGKSVCINTLIMSILYKASPEAVKLIMIDPKVVELSVYNGIPHLMIPVVTDPKKAAGALNWGVAEMTRRYQEFATMNVRDIKGYNAKVEQMPVPEEGEKPKKMPQIVIIVDELADLMMVAPGDVEEAICRLAQLARAAGIHLVLATQRPSVNVITGLIKANMPSRIAFSVSSGVDSRTIIDMNGAEKLLGKGDMLFYPTGYQKPARVQGSFVTDKEVQDVVHFLKSNHQEVAYDEEVITQVNSGNAGEKMDGGAASDEKWDAYFEEAGRLITDKEKASIGMMQRAFKIGFNRAARIMDQLCEAGVVGPEEGTKPRKVLMTAADFETFLSESKA